MSNYIERYWRDAKPEDAIKEPPMVARLRDGDKLNWSKPCELIGWIRRNTYQWIGKSGVWACCQVYDAPDPGEGWRLIDTEKEELHEGDEFLNKNGTWVRSLNKPMEGFTKGLPYRRRITPTVTYVPFTWPEREQLRGRYIYRNGYPENEFIILTIFQGSNGKLYAHGIIAETLCSGYTFADTGKPVGKEVTQ